MSTADATLRMILLGEDKSASKALKGVGDESDKTSKKMANVHKVGHAAGIALAGGLALAGAAAFKATKAAAEDQQSQANLARTLHAAAGATDAQVSSTEDWITAQGKAKGVADDDLRPALSKLAVATGSVSKAQHLASLAMDISAGTGKNLQSVAFALAKAQNGNVSGLARLGVQTTKTTKDTVALEKAQTAVKSAQLSYTAAVKAYGKGSAQASIAADKLKQAHEAVGAAQSKTTKTTLSLDQITKNLAKTYGGAASAEAETAAGKQKILTVQLHELQEQIGYALIPAMTKLSAIGIQMVSWVSRNATTVGILVGAIGGLLAVTWAVSAATKAWFAITKLITAAQIVFTNAQWALNIAMEANPIGLVVIAIAALVVGLVIAYKKSATFRAIVQGAFHAVQAAAAFAFNWVKSHWKLLAVIVGGPIVAAALVIAAHWKQIRAGAAALVGAIRSVFSRVLAYITAPFRTAVGVVTDIWTRLRGPVTAYVAFMASIPGKILHAMGNLGALLYGAGRALVQGLINGVESMAGSLLSKISSLASKVSSAFKKPLGIFSPSRVFLGHGVNIIKGLVAGIESQARPLQTVLDKVVSAVKAAGDKLKAAVSARNSFASGFGGFASSIFGMDAGTDADGNPLPVTAASILAAQQGQRDQAGTVKTDVRKLIKMGLSKSLIKQLQASGPSGIAQLQALASASPAQIKQLNALNAQTSSDLHAAGMSAGNAIYGKEIAQDKHRYNETKHILEKIRDAVEGQNKKELIARIKGGELEIVLAHHKRVNKGSKKLAFESNT